MTRLGAVMCIVLMLCAPAATQSNSEILDGILAILYVAYLAGLP